jgi:hypothetical protein
VSREEREGGEAGKQKYYSIKHHRNKTIKDGDELEIERMRKHDKKKHGDGA